MSNSYLSNERLQHYQDQDYFTVKCPRLEAVEFMHFASERKVEEAYELHEAQYLDNELVQERHMAMGTLDKLFGYLFQQPILS